MEDSSGVVVALIAAIASLLATSAKIIWDALEKRRERKATERAELRRYRSLLFGVAYELGNRIGNIRSDYFLQFYLGPESDREAMALRSTLFRFGQYFTWAEIYREYLRLNPDKLLRLKADTEEISITLNKIASKFASDKLDRDGTRTSRLMLWREEQSAIADSMRKPGSPTECIGFFTFTNEYKVYGEWLRRFENDLKHTFSQTGSGHSQRLTEVQNLLVQLLIQIDVEKALLKYKDGRAILPEWTKNPAKSARKLPDRTRALTTEPSSDIGQE